LDPTEKESLAQAIADGSLILPPHAPGKEMFPNEGQRLDHFAEMYARLAVYDANHDGELDSGEEAAVRQAIENGELVFPRRKGARRHPSPSIGQIAPSAVKEDRSFCSVLRDA
jgi:hypothetical protein